MGMVVHDTSALVATTIDRPRASRSSTITGSPFSNFKATLARVVSGTSNTVVGSHINRVPSPRQTIRATYLSPLLGDYTVIWRHEGHTTTLQGAWLDPFTVVDANVRREIVPGLRGFVSVENVGDVRYQINIAGAGANALVSYGLPRTVRVGLEASRY